MRNESLFSATRDEALARWEEFLPKLGRYAANRNQVTAQHENVSRLSPAIRYRLLTEQELIARSLELADLEAIEKWLQELCWRRYWKGWLEHHPQVWWDFLAHSDASVTPSVNSSQRQRADELTQASSGVAIIDYWTRELLETGYMHNHARMWWASYWIHVERLPWQWGAAFFYRHLLDADPASNTLSWRWVGGLQTLGKHYLVRWSNMQRYAGDLLQQHMGGAERLFDPDVSAHSMPLLEPECAQSLPIYPEHVGLEHRCSAIWVHGDDLSPEYGPLAEMRPQHVLLTPPWHNLPRSAVAEQWQQRALADCRARCERHFSGAIIEIAEPGDPCAHMLRWARQNELNHVMCLAPNLGALPTSIDAYRARCIANGVNLQCLRRPEDQWAYAQCRKGFFPYWQKQRRQLLLQFPPRQQQWDF